MSTFKISQHQILKRIQPDVHPAIYLMIWLMLLFSLILCTSLLAIYDLDPPIQQLELEQLKSIIQKAFFANILLSGIFWFMPQAYINSLPFALYQYFLKPTLKADFQQQRYQVLTGEIIALENISDRYLVSKGQQKITIRGETGASETFQLNIMRLYSKNQHLDFMPLLPSNVIGQRVEICYLPLSKHILQIWFNQKPHDMPYYHLFNNLLFGYCDVQNPPSKRQYSSLTWVEIQASRIEHHQHHTIQLTLKNADGISETYHQQQADFEKFYRLLQQQYRLCSLQELQEKLVLHPTITLYRFASTQAKMLILGITCTCLLFMCATYMQLPALLLCVILILLWIKPKLSAHRGWLTILPTSAQGEI